MTKMTTSRFTGIVIREVRRTSSFLNQYNSKKTIMVLDEAYKVNDKFELSVNQLNQMIEELQEIDYNLSFLFIKGTVLTASKIQSLHNDFDYGMMEKEDFINAIAHSLKTDRETAIRFIKSSNANRSVAIERKLISMAIESGYKA